MVVASIEDAHFTLLQAQYKDLVRSHGYHQWKGSDLVGQRPYI